MLTRHWCLWCSLLDLLWGFNHLVLTKRASELLSIMTSLGVLSPTVMQFGAHNGPTNMQSTVRRVFRRLGERFRAFIDDCCVATGSATGPKIEDPCDERNSWAMDQLETAILDFLEMVLITTEN